MEIINKIINTKTPNKIKILLISKSLIILTKYSCSVSFPFTQLRCIENIKFPINTIGDKTI